MFATIGYEKCSLDDFVATLVDRKIEVLVDIRDRAQSRRRGFSKTALAEAVGDAGIDYIHIKALGDPKEGREAARAGLMDKFRKIFIAVLSEETAQNALSEVESLAKEKKICLMCYERDHHVCHRKIVSDHLERALGCKAIHLGVPTNAAEEFAKGRVFHTRESAAA
ncbi:MAG: DUF488 domain-containing protein [Ahrensia sp.]|nr:DUF488 domain-containing protein [Ahrensia sp.]